MKKFPSIPGYRIIKELGKGGMARIFLAFDEKIEREVAIKVLLRKLIEDEEVTKRFLREAKTAAKLEHTNIVSIYDVGQVEDFYYFTMEYLEGNLKEKELEPLAALEIIKQIAEALIYAHNEGFIHRDIKPENILFRNDGTPVLVDFGIVRAADSTTKLTKTGVAIGTPFYMSPEQISGMGLDHRADLYSLGVVLYEILTGKVPYGGTDVISISLKHLNEPIPKLPENLSRYQPLVEGLMAKDREDRIQSAEELIMFIDAYIQGKEREFLKSRNIATKRRGRAKPGDRKGETKQSKLARFWPIGLLLLAVIGISVYHLYQSYWQEKETPQGKNDTKETVSSNKKKDTRLKPIKAKPKTIDKDQEFNRILVLVRESYEKRDYEEAKKNISLAKEIKITSELETLEQEVDKQIIEMKNKAGMEKEEQKSQQDAESEQKNVVEYLKLKEKPSYIRAVETKAEKVYKNKKGYWEAVFFNDTVMVYVPAGNFRMGLNAGDPDQRPGHNVYLDGYWISKYEVTFDQFDRFCDETGAKKPKDRNWGRSKRPVIYISWRSAQNYCEWLVQKTGLKFDLPTEAQWEKAARGPTGRLYPWGDSLPDRAKANFKSAKDGSKYTAVVGAYPTGESPYGILDLAGNVWEWCRDWYDADHYATPATSNPTGPLRGSSRVVRGGSWKNGTRYIRATHRARSSPSSRDPYTGFRIVIELSR